MEQNWSLDKFHVNTVISSKSALQTFIFTYSLILNRDKANKIKFS